VQAEVGRRMILRTSLPTPSTFLEQPPAASAPLRRAERLLNEPLAYRLNGRRTAPKAVPLDLAGQPLAECRAEEDVLDAGLRGKHH